jgi:hypothetical protein
MGMVDRKENQHIFFGGSVDYTKPQKYPIPHLAIPPPNPHSPLLHFSISLFFSPFKGGKKIKTGFSRGSKCLIKVVRLNFYCYL